MSPEMYACLRADIIAYGYAHDIEWSETLRPVENPEQFAREYIFVVCNSGMKAQIATKIFVRILDALHAGGFAVSVFGHKAKAQAIDQVWSARQGYFEAYQAVAGVDQRLAYLQSLPWIGAITKWHLAKNLGLDVAKPDRHLVRVARAYGTTVEALCENLAQATGDRIATVDTVIWRACNLELLAV